MRFPKHIGGGIASALRDLGLSGRLKQYEALEVWHTAVGDTIARVTTPEGIRNGCLIIKVSHSAWRNELQFLKRELIDKVNTVLQHNVITDIKFR